MTRRMLGSAQVVCRTVDWSRNISTMAAHHPERGECCKAQALRMKLVDGEFQPVTLTECACDRRALGLVFQRQPHGAKSFEDSGFVGVVFVSDRHGESG